MTRLYKARELAGLPGLPGTARGIAMAAVREGWPRERLPGSAKAWGYPVGPHMPEAARVEIAKREIARVRAELPLGAATLHTSTHNDTGARTREAGRLAGAPRWARRRADARLAIVEACEWYRRAGGFRLTKGQHLFAHAYNTGAPLVDGWVRAALKKVSAGSLQRWRKLIAEGGAAPLGGRYGNRRGSGVIDRDREIADCIAALIFDRPHASNAYIMAAVRERYPDRRLPSYRSVQRYIARWRRENAGALSAVGNPDRHRSTRMPAFGDASAGVERVNQLWEMDSTPADVMCTDGRHAIVGALDVYSRRAKVQVAPSSSAAAISALLKRCIVDWGVPEAVRTDEGSDYTSRHVRRVLADLEVVHDVLPPYSPEGKPFIERFLGTLSHGLFEQLPGYAGHSVADAQAIRSRKSFAARRGEGDAEAFSVELTAAELQARCDDWCENAYGRRPHQGLGGRSPFLAAAGARRRVIENERALDVLLAVSPDGDGTRVVGKKGIRCEGTVFIGRKLGALVGERVHVRLQPDMGRIWVFDTDGEYICQAFAIEREGLDRREVAIEARRLAKAADSEARAWARELARRFKPHRVADDLAAAAKGATATVLAYPDDNERFELRRVLNAGDAASEADSGEDASEATVLSLEEEAEKRCPFDADGHPKPWADDRTFCIWVIRHLEDTHEGERNYALSNLEKSNSLCDLVQMGRDGVSDEQLIDFFKYARYHRGDFKVEGEEDA